MLHLFKVGYAEDMFTTFNSIAARRYSLLALQSRDGLAIIYICQVFYPSAAPGESRY